MELPTQMTSLWESSLGESRSQPWDRQPFEGPAETDVAIVGSGITGLSAALRARALGNSVSVLDAAQPGWGASGRNGGQVIPGLKSDPDEIIRRLGAEKGERMIAFAGAAADTVFDAIESNDIDCGAQRGGWIVPTYNSRGMKALEAKCEQWQARGAAVEMLDGPAVGAATGSARFAGGFLDRRAGSVHPLQYTLGLADAAHSQGVRIHADAAVTDITQRGGRFEVVTHAGVLRAERVLVCTNGYTDAALGPVASSFAPVASIQIATEPLPRTLRETIMRDHVCASDSNRLMVYFRLDPQGRFLIGGRGATSADGLERLFEQLCGRAIGLFPALHDVSWPYRWGGLVAITADHYPHLHEPTPGLVMALGYNGRGVALATALGAAVADYAASGDPAALPFTPMPIKRFPFYAFRTIGVEMTCFWYGLLDRLKI